MAIGVYDPVSIHAPWEGCDSLLGGVFGYFGQVSIHAPWEGCDSWDITGWRPRSWFQFTHPGKGVTVVL